LSTFTTHITVHFNGSTVNFSELSILVNFSELSKAYSNLAPEAYSGNAIMRVNKSEVYRIRSTRVDSNRS